MDLNKYWYQRIISAWIFLSRRGYVYILWEKFKLIINKDINTEIIDLIKDVVKKKVKNG